MLCFITFSVNIVTRATTRERKPNGSLPKLRGVPYKIWGCKINKINSSWFVEKKRIYGALLQYSSCSTSEICVAAEICLFDSIGWSTLILEMVDIDNKLYGQWTLKNILNIDDAHTRISTIVPDTNLDTYPEFLFEQCSKVSVPVSNC